MAVRRLTPRFVVLGLCILALNVGLISALPASGVAQVWLDTPTATFPEDFGAIQTVRELPDGRVLVADPLGKALYAVDLDGNRRTLVGREGQGPTEYRQPDAVWPLPDGRTLLVDLGNGRLTILGSDLAFGDTHRIAVGEPQMGRPMVIAIPQGVDGNGMVYSRAMGGGMGGGAYPDSAEILRIDPAEGTSTSVATFKIQSVTQQTSGGANDQRVAISPIPLSPQDAWGVAPDGTIIIARVGDYHLERIGSGGSVARGPVIPFDPVRIGRAEKEEYVASQSRSGGGIAVGVEVENGQMSMSFARGGADDEDRQIDQYTWPEEKPPFYGGRIPVDAAGRAWIQRHVDAGEPSTYDVFDAGGNRVNTVLLEHGKRVVGFGQNTVYVVAFDEFDLNYLERYALPR